MNKFEIAREQLLEDLEKILYEVQYAPMGQKTAMRKKYAKEIVECIEIVWSLKP